MKYETNLSRAYIDVDTIRAPALRPYYAVCRIVGVRPLWIAYERTRRGWHVVIQFGSRDRFTPAELVAFQACCGSDIRRESLNLMRVCAIRRGRLPAFWRKRWNLLFVYKPR